jgi:hypothetical protein
MSSIIRIARAIKRKPYISGSNGICLNSFISTKSVKKTRGDAFKYRFSPIIKTLMPQNEHLSRKSELAILRTISDIEEFTIREREGFAIC